MTWMEPLVLVAHLLVAAAVCGFVLMQHGKGADMGAAFGSGSSGSLFGAAGSANFLSRTTAILASVFFLTSIALTFFGTLHGRPQGLIEQGVMEKSIPAPTAPGAPASTVPKDVPASAPSSAPSDTGNAKPGEVPK